jgi:hypothetical protein
MVIERADAVRNALVTILLNPIGPYNGGKAHSPR